jgi:excinuclease UvrABC helicase subunit UvrB
LKIETLKASSGFLEHLLAKLDAHIKSGGRALILTLTKKSSEEVTNFLVSK